MRLVKLNNLSQSPPEGLLNSLFRKVDFEKNITYVSQNFHKALIIS